MFLVLTTYPSVCRGGFHLTCLYRACYTRALPTSVYSTMQQAPGHPASQSSQNTNRNRKRSLQRQSGVSAGPPGFESLHLQDGRGMHTTSEPGQKQARLQQRPRPQGLATVSAVSQAEPVLSQPPPGSAQAPAQGARTSSTTRAHLTEVHFADLPICSATKRSVFVCVTLIYCIQQHVLAKSLLKLYAW